MGDTTRVGKRDPAAALDPAGDHSLWSFLIIGIGSLGCIAGGLASRHVGSARVAYVQLSASGICCLLSPLLFFASPALFLAFMLL